MTIPAGPRTTTGANSSTLIRLVLTPRQALILWQTIDGAADAGACDGGLLPHESRALEQINAKLLDQHAKWKAAS